MSGAYPWTTATGRSAATDTGRSLRSRSASLSATAPATSTGDPAGNRLAISVAAAWEEVTTSAALVAIPSLPRCSAIADGDLDALFVTNASRRPALRAAASAATAPGTACGPL